MCSNMLLIKRILLTSVSEPKAVWVMFSVYCSLTSEGRKEAYSNKKLYWLVSILWRDCISSKLLARVEEEPGRRPRHGLSAKSPGTAPSPCIRRLPFLCGPKVSVRAVS